LKTTLFTDLVYCTFAFKLVLVFHFFVKNCFQENQVETVAKQAVESELDNDLQSAVARRRKRREDSLLGQFFMKNLRANFTKTVSRIEQELIPGLSSRFGSQSAVTKVRPSYII